MDDHRVKVSRLSLGQQIADAVRRDIIFGRLEAGTKLTQEGLCEIYGTSRIPVRDALRQLQFEGFLSADGGRHASVVRITRRDIQDTFWLEAMLHGLATRRVAETATADQMGELRVLHQDMVDHSSDPDYASDVNWHFHRRINQLAGSRRISAALKSVASALPRDFLTEIPGWADRANHEHAGILEAMKDRDADAAEKLMQEHIELAGDGFLHYLEANGVDLE